MDNLGEVLKERRQAKKLKLKQLAAMSGVSISYLGRIEQGTRFPSGRILRKLAEPLGFNEVELVKLAGFISRDESDDRLDRFKDEVKTEIAITIGGLLKKIDSL